MDKTEEQKITKRINIGIRKMGQTRICMASVLAVLLLSGGCGHGPDQTASPQPGTPGEVPFESREPAALERDQGTDQDIEEACRSLTVRESPVDTVRYDAQTDRIYKEAFLKAITGQAPIRYRDRQGTTTYRGLLPDGVGMGEEAFLKAVRQSDFFYQDYDGDGLPELIIDTEGPCVLKYHPKEDQVELYQQKEQGWHPLGAGQMITDLSGMRDVHYRYESVDGEPISQASYRWSSEDGYDCQVTLDGQAYTVTDREIVDQLDQAFDRMITDVPHPMSFAVLFGDGEEQGYLPGGEEPPCYLLEETAALPLNEESGEEWELYRSMMEGDFSLVEDEHWGSLQSHYEDDLEKNRGSCSWSYLLMDFDQDGTKELMIRLYPDLVNTTAYFHYEDGHVKMWEGSYMSADQGYYTVPLVNGRILGVEWYQDYKEWWIKRPDPQRWGRYAIREKNYSRAKSMSLQELKEGDAGYYKFQDYYHDGALCGTFMDLLPEEWEQIEEMVEGLLVPEEAWKPCSVFTPKAERPEIPGVGALDPRTGEVLCTGGGGVLDILFHMT